MPEGTTNRLQLVLASTLESVNRVEETALAFAVGAGFDQDTASNVAMVAREAAVNAVVHGNRYSAEKQVTSCFERAADAVRISVADEGEGMDAEAIPDPLAPENLLRASGRGVFLMRSFMDEVLFERLSPGMKVTLVKRRSTTNSHPMSREKGEQR